jgi:TolB-like protein
MSRLFLATDLRHDRKVVVKVLTPDLETETSIARFKREIELTIRLQHPHILPIITSGEWSDGRYYITPFAGESLRARIAREKILPLADILEILKDVSSALSFAHSRGIAHRDVKPGNILLADGRAILADFGIARAANTMSTPLTISGLRPGTPAYMPPGVCSDERSDYYALGVVAFEMLSGALPHAGDLTVRRVVALRGDRRDDSPALVSQLVRAVTAALSAADRDAPPVAPPLHSIFAAVREQRPWWRNPLTWTGAAAVVALASVMPLARGRLVAVTAPVDSTRVVVFPFDSEPAAQSGQVTELLVEALSRWRGVSVVDPFLVSDVTARAAASGTKANVRELARSLGAGRYVRGRVSTVGDSIRVTAVLYDVARDAPLYSVSAHGARGSNYAGSVDSLASALLLRRTDQAATATLGGTNSLPAVQAFAAGLSALERWDLRGADSAFGEAVRLDPAYGRAGLWQAQAKDWERVTPSASRDLITSALRDSSRLSKRERELGSALASLVSGNYASACKKYDAMRKKDDRDFAAWYGLGRCQSLDDQVVRDSALPSGWAYRSSYHRGVLAFTRAFELLPLAHRGFAGGAFGSLEALLFVRSDRLRFGFSAADTTRFAARPTWIGDTLAFFPFPLADVLGGAKNTFLPGNAEALQHQRAVLHGIAEGWARAFPASASAREALAMSLDGLGDATAVDTLSSARALSVEPTERLRLASAEALLRFKYAFPDKLDQLRLAKRIADSITTNAGLLDAHPSALVPLAELRGQCDRAITAAMRAATALSQPVAVPVFLTSRSAALLVAASINCPVRPGMLSLQQLDALIERDIPASSHFLSRTVLEAQVAALIFPNDSAWIATFASAGSSSPIYLAERAALRGEQKVALDAIHRLHSSRLLTPRRDGLGSPDAILAEARVLVAVGDSSGAAAWLDSALAHVRDYPLPALQKNDAAIGSILLCAALRAELAAARREDATAARFAAAIVELWSGADPGPRAVLDRMKKLARNQSTPGR